jgi:hypothetical protein
MKVKVTVTLNVKNISTQYLEDLLTYSLQNLKGRSPHWKEGFYCFRAPVLECPGWPSNFIE